MTGARHPDWRAIHADLARRDLENLSASELDLLGECLFWLDRPEDSIRVLGRAFAAHLAAGDRDGAAMAAWQLYYDHALVGEAAQANGWMERLRRHCAGLEGSVAAGFLAVAECDRAAASGHVDEALTHADHAVEVGEGTGDPDLLAMALQAKGRALIGGGRTAEGVSALDEAMIAAVNGELAPLFTGWVYCNALATCHDLADLRRASEWCDAAARWCDGLLQGRLYRGLCRIHVVELASLRGTWDTARELAQQACDELTSHDARYAGAAHYLIGELHRLTGDLDLAEEAYIRAHELGYDPQPGLARVRVAQGRVEAALRSLRLAVDPPRGAPLRRAELLAALVDTCVEIGAPDAAREAASALAAVAREVPSEYLAAVATVSEASAQLAGGDAGGACNTAAGAVVRFGQLGLPYHEARARELRGGGGGGDRRARHRTPRAPVRAGDLPPAGRRARRASRRGPDVGRAAVTALGA